MAAAAGDLEMNEGRHGELEGLASWLTAAGRDVRWAMASLSAPDGVSSAEIVRRCACPLRSPFVGALDALLCSAAML